MALIKLERKAHFETARRAKSISVPLSKNMFYFIVVFHIAITLTLRGLNFNFFPAHKNIYVAISA